MITQELLIVLSFFSEGAKSEYNLISVSAVSAATGSFNQIQHSSVYLR